MAYINHIYKWWGLKRMGFGNRDRSVYNFYKEICRRGTKTQGSCQGSGIKRRFFMM